MCGGAFAAQGLAPCPGAWARKRVRGWGEGLVIRVGKCSGYWSRLDEDLGRNIPEGVEHG